MFKDISRFIINIVVVAIGMLLTYLCWEYLGSDQYDPFDASDEITLSVIFATALILYYINRPPKNAVHKGSLNKRLTRLSVFIYEMLIDIDKQLIKCELSPVFDEPIKTEKEQHPIISCHKIVYRIIESSPKDLSQERKEYTEFINILKDKEAPLAKNLYEIREESKEQDPKLLENINSTLFQLEKITQKTTYNTQTLHKELTKLFITIQEVCDYIETNYPEYDKKQWK